jgi:EAL domain-containing protein (putative c-di-GMP-specific phosphodiesterase class I)
VFALAEEHRLGERLNAVVLHNVFARFVELRDARKQPELELAFNVSPHRMHQEGLGNTLLADLQQAGLQPEQVVVEITEEAILSPSEPLRHNLDVLRRAGVRIGIDDFGTGYSSLVLLLNLRPDEIKLDQSIVGAIQNDPLALQIIRLMVNLAAQTQIELVAEGVEDQAVLEQLLELGVERLQGYLLGEPVPWQALCDTGHLPRVA